MYIPVKNTTFWVVMAALSIGFSAPLPVEAQGPSTGIETAPAAISVQVVQLYFFAEDGRHLRAEPVEMAAGQRALALVREVLRALFQGPKTALWPIFSRPLAPRSFFIDDQGTAYVDLPGTVGAAQPGGIAAEHLALYAIVNSLVLNVPEVTAVKVLIDGQETESFAGHIDISYPLTANLLLIR